MIRRLALSLAAVLCLGVTAQAQNRVALAGGTSLDPGSSWGYYDGSDAPEGAYLQNLPTDTNTVYAVVALGETLPAGTYNVFVKGLDYDLVHFDVTATLGDGSGTTATDDRDVYKRWDEPAEVTSTISFNEATIEFDQQTPSIVGKCLFQALYITDNLGEVVLNTDEVFTYVEPYVGSEDNSAATGGNLVYNGSFETPPINQGNIDQQQYVPYLWDDLWTTDEAHSGTHSIALPANPGGFNPIWLWEPMLMPSNKVVAFSLWAKTDTGTAYGNLVIQNVHTAPTGFTNTQSWTVSGSNTVGSTWQEYTLTGRIAEYPVSEIQLSFNVQTNSGATTVYIDDLAIKEGTSTGTWEPRYDLEMGVDTGKVGDVYVSGESDQNMKVYLYNNSGSLASSSVRYQFFDWKNVMVSSGSLSVSCAAGSTNIYNIGVPTDSFGWHKGNFWLTGQDRIIERSWVMMRDFSDELVDLNSSLGVHSNSRFAHQNAIMQRIRAKGYRGLSTGQWWHWGRRETNDNEFATHFGPYISEPVDNNNMAWLACFYQTFDDGVQKSWMTNLTARITNSSSTLNIAERVTNTVSSSGGFVSYREYTNTAFIQVSNFVGTLQDGDTLTGIDSGATVEVFENGFMGFDIPQWSNFVYTAMSADSNKVEFAECLNEPDEEGFPNWLYAKLLWKFAEAIELGDNTVQVVALGGRGFNGNNPLNDAEEIMGLLPSTDRIDYASLHFYPGNEGVAHWFNTNWSYPTIGLWNTEAGWFGYDGVRGSGSNERLGARNYVWPWRSNIRPYSGVQNATEQVSRNYIRTIGAGFQKWFYYDARQGGSDVDDFSSHTSVYNWRLGLRPVGALLPSIAYWLHDAQGHNLVDAGNDNVLVLLFTRDSGDPLLSVWCEDDVGRTLTLSTDIAEADFNVFDVMGNEISISGRAVPIDRVPVIIASTNSVTTNTLKTAVTSGTLAARSDTTAPNMAFELFPTTSTNHVHQIRLYAYDEEDFLEDLTPEVLEYRLRVNGGAWSSWSPEAFFEYGGAVTSLEAEARDSSGNTTSQSFSPTESQKSSIGGSVIFGGSVVF